MTLPPITPEFAISMVALAVGTAVGIYMAARRPVDQQLGIVGQPFGNSEELQAEDDMASTEFQQEVLPLFEERNADLVKRLREVAQKCARERSGGITSADVITALERDDPVMHKRLQVAERRIMGAVFTKAWMQTGEWRKTGSRGRPQPVWVLKDGKAA